MINYKTRHPVRRGSSLYALMLGAAALGSAQAGAAPIKTMNAAAREAAADRAFAAREDAADRFAQIHTVAKTQAKVDDAGAGWEREEDQTAADRIATRHFQHGPLLSKDALIGLQRGAKAEAARSISGKGAATMGAPTKPIRAVVRFKKECIPAPGFGHC